MKATKATIRQRVEELLAIRLDGALFPDMRQYVAEKEAAGEAPWAIPEGGKPVSERTLWRYIALTEKLMAESVKESRKKLLRRHLAQRMSLYAKAVSQGDVRAALAVLRDEAELQGLYDADLYQQVEELKRQIEEIKHSGHPDHPQRTPEIAPRAAAAAPAGGEPHPGPAAG